MTDNDRLMQILLDVHSGLPRQGPGDDESTLRALAACAELPMRPGVLDIACGPGMQTVALARGTDGTITAVDLFEQFLDQLRERATEAGVRDRVQVMLADMSDLPFGKDSFDLIWCEGAAYIMGITEAFIRWKEFLRPEGYIAVTEISWLVPEAEVPRRAFDFFHSEYPGITDVPGNLARIEACGYEIVDHFTLPGEAWWTDYYTPLEAKLDALRSKYAVTPPRSASSPTRPRSCACAASSATATATSSSSPACSIQTPSRQTRAPARAETQQSTCPSRPMTPW